MSNHQDMIKSFFRTTFRSFLKNKAYTFINVLGLSIGISSAIVIYTIINFERSYDQYHTDLDRLYRVVMEANVYGEIDLRTGVAYPMPFAVKDEIQDLEYVAIVDGNFSSPVFKVETNGGVSNHTENAVFTNNDFLQMFTFTWLGGDAATALANPNSVVITRAVAERFFNTTDVVGRVISYQGEEDLQITGVLEDPPLNSEFQFNMYLPFELKGDPAAENWNSVSDATHCYIKLDEGVDYEDIDFALSDFIARHREIEEGVSFNSYLQPVADIHLEPQYGFSFNRLSSKETLYGMAVIGFFILFTAVINFINLNTVLVIKRSKEVGVRKVLGGNRWQFIAHFLGETGLITLFSLVVSFGFIELVALQIDQLLGFHLEFAYWTNIYAILFIMGVYLVTTLLSGIYPAWVLANVQPAIAMKKRISGGEKGKSTLRRSLVVVQFVISQVLIVGTIVVSQQIDYFMNSPQGFDSEAIVEVTFYSREKQDQETFRNTLVQESSIVNVSLSNTGAANSNVWTTNATIYTDNEELTEQAQIKLADEHFIDTYQLQLVAGEGLIRSDTANRVVVNEELARTFGFANPQEIIGKEIRVWAGRAPVTGVVKDFVSVSMHQEIQPLVIVSRKQSYYMAAIKINSANIQQALGKIEESWTALFPDRVFEYTFLDDRIASYYEDEQRTSRTIQIFSGLAIFIGCMGLFGLVSFMATQRTKEVGVRKVLGATVASIVMLFSREFLLLVILAFLIAAPTSYYFMDQWLQEFAYKIDISWWIMASGIAFSIFIALATVSYKSYKAAVANPVDALRDE